jgi:ABC-type nitrate/sulfonate/bicarbonate transport system substrate-binding protein
MAQERQALRLGLALEATGWLPIYVAATHTAADEGLQIDLAAFNGDAGAAQALASDSVQVAVVSLSGLLQMIAAGLPVKGFYAGLNQAAWEWFGQADLRGWADVRGKTVAIASFAGLTDVLTRHVLRKHGLEPGRDVQLVQIGGSATRLESLRARRVAVTMLTAPFKWQAAAAGLVRLGTQATEVARDWPTGVFCAKESFLAGSPGLLRALVRAHVRAIRLARADSEVGIATLSRRLRYERGDAERAYREAIAAADERGLLPQESMAVFWSVMRDAGEVTAPWPESRFLDRRFIDALGP